MSKSAPLFLPKKNPKEPQGSKGYLPDTQGLALRFALLECEVLRVSLVVVVGHEASGVGVKIVVTTNLQLALVELELLARGFCLVEETLQLVGEQSRGAISSINAVINLRVVLLVLTINLLWLALTVQSNEGTQGHLRRSPLTVEVCVEGIVTVVCHKISLNRDAMEG